MQLLWSGCVEEVWLQYVVCEVFQVVGYFFMVFVIMLEVSLCCISMKKIMMGIVMMVDVVMMLFQLFECRLKNDFRLIEIVYWLVWVLRIVIVKMNLFYVVMKLKMLVVMRFGMISGSSIEWNICYQFVLLMYVVFLSLIGMVVMKLCSIQMLNVSDRVMQIIIKLRMLLSRFRFLICRNSGMMSVLSGIICIIRIIIRIVVWNLNLKWVIVIVVSRQIRVFMRIVMSVMIVELCRQVLKLLLVRMKVKLFYVNFCGRSDCLLLDVLLLKVLDIIQQIGNRVKIRMVVIVMLSLMCEWS